MCDEQPKKKVQRTRSNKKWENREIILLLDYLDEAETFETPTAQMFYKKCIERKNIEATWDLLKWKVRHLKTSYNKACAWRNSTGAGLLESDGAMNIQDKLQKMCPYFDRLDDIFGSKKQNAEIIVIDTDMEPHTATNALIEFDSSSSELDAVYNMSYETENNLASETIVQTPIIDTPKTIVPENARKFSDKMQSSAPRKQSNATSNLMQFQIERANVQKLRLEYEKEKLTKQHEIDEKRIKLEEKKLEEELKIRQEELLIQKLAMEQQERLKTMELEKDERIAMYELECKYRQKH